MVKLRINKMFGKYTNELDLFKKCLILIGENGLVPLPRFDGHMVKGLK